MKYTITTTEDQDAILQTALEGQNAYRTNAGMPLLTIESMLQARIEAIFGLAAETIESNRREQLKSALIAKIEALPTDSFPAVTAVVDAEKP